MMDMIEITSDGEGQHFVEAIADNGKTPLLLIHGFMSSRAQWRDNLVGLSEFSRPILVELFGHGRSPSPIDAEHYSLDHIFADFERIRSVLGYPDWAVCGHSLGGAIALNYALHSPNSVSHIVFTNSRSAIQPADGDLAQDSGNVPELLKEHGRSVLDKLPFHPKLMSRVSDTLKSELVTDAELINPEGVIGLTTRSFPQINVRSRLNEIEPPVMLVNGKFEKKFQSLRDWLERVGKPCTIIDLEAGHSPNAEEPEAFNEAVRCFIES